MEVDKNELKDFINNYIRERVQGDGGEISFTSFSQNVLTVTVQAECSKCPLTDNCFKDWMLNKIYEKFKVRLSINMIRKKPYFWDK